MSNKPISSKALDNDKLENVSGGATIYKTEQGNLISLSKGEQHFLKMLNFDINPSDSSGRELFASIKDNNGKSYSPAQIARILEQDKFQADYF